jgi:hypothetical protein
MSSKQRRKRRAAARSRRAESPDAAQDEAAPAQPKAARVETARRTAASRDERPPAPWGSFPLVELVVVVALVMLVGGFVLQGARGVAMIVTGLALGALAGLELSIREHFAGFRSHTLLLAGVVAIAVLVALSYAAPSALAPAARLGAAAAVFALCAWGLTTAFRRRAGVRVKLR